ncbi:MAG: TonB family protein [Acidobacteria bacterium]|nr:TonB family protein [Acidobacteriota bacterium]MBI3657452.1 TonB family protein [Acidobacteriota bacterium]
MKYCPRCQQEWLDRFNYCPEDATSLTASLPDPLLGVVFGNKLEVTARLGAGAHGVVYQAHHRFLNEWRTIKFLAHDPSQGGAFPELTHSLSLAERLRSEHTVRLLDFDQIDARYVVICELAEGDSLTTILRSQGALPLNRALEIIRQIGQSLNEAHEMGLSHLSLKPNNIMVASLPNSPAGILVKVCDYYTSGLPKVYATATREAGMKPDVSRLYAAPEQLATGAGDPHSDIFALGRLLQHMITGHLNPFRLDEGRRLDEELRPFKTPESIIALIRRLLDLSPQNRPTVGEVLFGLQTASALAHETLSQGLPSGTRPQAQIAPAATELSAATTGTMADALNPPKLQAAPASPTMEEFPQSGSAALIEPQTPFLPSPENTPSPMVDEWPARHRGDIAESPVAATAAATRPDAPTKNKLGRWVKTYWIIPLALCALVVLTFNVREHLLTWNWLAKLRVESDFMLLLPLLATGLLLMTYAVWLWTNRRGSTDSAASTGDDAARVKPNQPIPTMITVMPARDNSVPASPPATTAVAQLPVEAAAAPHGQEPLPASEPLLAAATSLIEPTAQELIAPITKLGSEEEQVLPEALEEETATDKSRAPTFRFDTLMPAHKKSLMARLISFLKPVRTGASLFDYAMPADDAGGRFTWAEWVDAFTPSFSEVKIQSSLFANGSSDTSESEPVEIGADILEILAQRPRRAMPSMISSLFGDFAAMGNDVRALRRRRTITGALSLTFHIAAGVFLVWVVLQKGTAAVLDLKKPIIEVTMLVPPPTIMRAEPTPPKDGGGGGGGGKLEETPPSPGRLPKTNALQLVPPDPKPRPMVSRDALLAEPSVEVPIEIPTDKRLPIGDITAPPDKMALSSGPGRRGGIGIGSGTGIGSGSGPGVGPGSGGGIGGGQGGGVGAGQGPYVSGYDGVRAPTILYMLRPDYTEAAQRAKVEGMVKLKVLVDQTGRVGVVHLVKGLGYGLDESAIQTVKTKWQFQPGTYHGQPVDVWVEVEISFNMP